MHILQDFVIIMIAAIAVLLLFSRLKLPSVIGFLFTGFIIGPSMTNIVSSTHEIELFAEVGVMLLMFTIGLEFSLETIRRMTFEVLVLGSLQVVITIAAVLTSMLSLGYGLPESMAISFIVSMSSTAIVMKLLHDRGKLRTVHGRIMTGILLFQDFCVILFIIMLPLFASIREIEAFPVLTQLFKSLFLASLIFVLAKYFFPKIFDYVCRFRLRETFMLLALSMCFGLGLITGHFGFSLAMGSFVAGMILAESQYLHQIEAEIKSLRTVFISLFFVSIGMLLNLEYVAMNGWWVLAGVVGLIALKFLLIFLILLLMRYPVNISLGAAASLAQIGEFSFLLLTMSSQMNILTDSQFQYFLAITIISMVLTPFIVILGEKIAYHKRFRQKFVHSEKLAEMENHIIIAGFGINGMHLARIFKVLGIPYSVIEFNPITVKKYRMSGENIMFGDITHADNLRHLGIEKASMMIVAISDSDSTRKAVELARSMNPSIQIIVRSEYLHEMELLYKKGANEVVSQEFEATIQVASQVLKKRGISDQIIHIHNLMLRQEQYHFFEADAVNEASFNLSEMAAINELCDLYLVRFSLKISGITAAHLNETFRSEQLNVAILGVIRKDRIIREQLESAVVQKHDSLILFGVQKHIDKAKDFLDTYLA
ncbi:MAG: hypothetical protein DWQ44_03185 [Bacteroidetes bacterium]|nr:MAG: hypothetical protein DWQ33_04620 [Bacteroidota bacterium]REJ99993.1 MAG: hypothetical protein DWQ39_13890 [Bacteroidota bacterium]REK35827.1 MAG: hypothetical protein DWQ44_03185 [Bacteroidota bacterium]REK49302.1 MAG: hypothetical protein DWQ48_07670 [Bacteroidota bacterium]